MIDSHPQAAQLQKEARVANKEDRERAEALSLLIKHPGWPIFQMLLGNQIQAQAEVLLASEQSMIAAQTNSEYVKGTMRGLIMGRDLASVTIAAMKELRAADPTEEAE